MNFVILMGRLTADPEITDYGDFSVINYTIAVSRNYTKRDGTRDTDFIDCREVDNSENRKRANFYKTYPKKGDAVSVQGSWQIDIYDDKEGKRIWRHFCRVRTFKFCGSNRRDDQSNTDSTQSNISRSNAFTPINQNNIQPKNNSFPAANVVPGKKSSWQQEIVDKPVENIEQSTSDNYQSRDIIPQAFDIGIDVDDEFMF